MIFDDDAISELVRILSAQGWKGSTDALSKLLSTQSAAASVRAFIQNLHGSPKAQAAVVEFANQFSRAYFDASEFGFTLSLSNPDSEREAAFKVKYRDREMCVWTRDREEEDYSIEHVQLGT